MLLSTDCASYVRGSGDAIGVRLYSLRSPNFWVKSQCWLRGSGGQDNKQGALIQQIEAKLDQNRFQRHLLFVAELTQVPQTNHCISGVSRSMITSPSGSWYSRRHTSYFSKMLTCERTSRTRSWQASAISLAYTPQS